MKHSIRKLTDFSIIGVMLLCFGTLSIAGHKPAADPVFLCPDVGCLLITNVEDLVADGTLSSGAGTSLIKQFENALKSLDKANDNAAIKQLAAFANEVHALIDGGVLTAEEGLPLIDAVLSIIDQILAVY